MLPKAVAPRPGHVGFAWTGGRGQVSPGLTILGLQSAPSACMARGGGTGERGGISIRATASAIGAPRAGTSAPHPLAPPQAAGTRVVSLGAIDKRIITKKNGALGAPKRRIFV